MNAKYIYIVSVLIVTMICIGCVGKTPEKASQIKTNVPVITDVHNGTSYSEATDSSGNVSSPGRTGTSGNMSSPEATEISGNIPPYGVTNVPTEDMSVTKTFKIGDENNMLGVNIKLVNITDYDNDTATLLINGVEYKYDSSSETAIRTSGIEIIDIIPLEDDKTAKITVDYAQK